jgi:hypothetical protein
MELDPLRRDRQPFYASERAQAHVLPGEVGNAKATLGKRMERIGKG